MICTGGQAGNLENFPLYFYSPDGFTWNGSLEPYSAQLTDIISIQGYAAFNQGGFNGSNVLFHDNGSWTLYFKDTNDLHTIYRATTAANIKTRWKHFF